MSDKQFIGAYKCDKCQDKFASIKVELRFKADVEDAIRDVEVHVGRIERVRLAGLE